MTRVICWMACFLGALLLLTEQARAAVGLPFSTSVELSSGGSFRAFDVDLGTLPARPVLVVEVVPDAAHSDMLTEIEVTNYQVPWAPSGSSCPFSTVSNVSRSGRLERPWYFCHPAGGYPGTTATVIVSALNFGSGGEPAKLDVWIRGETRPPTSTLVEQVSGSRRIVIPASKDTVLYQDAPSASNGVGQFLWAGIETQSQQTGPERRSLVAFDVASQIPSSATVEQAALRLQVVDAVPWWVYQPLRVHRVAPAANGWGWLEGTVDQPGDEFYGVAGMGLVADWIHRASPFPNFVTQPWTTPGGDPTGSLVLEVPFINSPGPIQSTSPELTAAIQDMVATGDSNDGFVLSNPGFTFPFLRRALQFASRDHPSSSHHPALVVDYTPQYAPTASGQIETSVLSFIDEGQNFRWIYDLDQDDVYLTPVGGVCTVVSRPPSQSAPLPYTYDYSGPPFTGVDCCTWRIDSADTGTVGVGQALFFHGLDPANPANRPPDGDLDGIRDLCDNCPARPNGPLLGTCRIGAPLGGVCHADRDCGPGGRCSLSQEDSNGDFEGNVCVVPEPSLASGLMAGMLAGFLMRIGRIATTSAHGRAAALREIPEVSQDIDRAPG